LVAPQLKIPYLIIVFGEQATLQGLNLEKQGIRRNVAQI